MKKIIVPTDFSSIARNAAQYALEMAKVTGKEILLFHAAGPDSSGASARLEEEASRLSTLAPTVKITCRFSDQAFNSETLHEMIRSNEVRLIVMGTVGKGADLSKKLLGRNATLVLEEVDLPIIAVPPGYKFKGIKKIAYASDLSRFDAETDRLMVFAKLFRAAVLIFHISPVFPDLGDVEKINMTVKLEETKQRHQYSAISYFPEEMPLDNQVNKGIKLFLANNDPDLLVMFHHKRSAFDQLFSSSHTSHMVSQLELPLMVYPKI